MPPERIIKYSDRVSTLMVWWRALFLVPPWGFVVLPIAGLLLRLTGSFWNQVGYGTLLIIFVLYLFRDILQRKIKLNDDNLIHGARTFPLCDLGAVDLIAESHNSLPRFLCLQFGSNALKLRLTRISADDLSFLISTIERRFPKCQIAPAVHSLSKLKHSRPKQLRQDSNRLEIPCHMHKPIAEMSRAFMSTAGAWSSSGPVVCFLTLGCIAGFEVYSYLYTMLQYSHSLGWDNGLKLRDILMEVSRDWSTFIWVSIYKGLKAPVDSIFHSKMVWLTMLVAFPLVLIYAAYIGIRPNRLSLDKNGLELYLNALSVRIPWKKVSWSEVIDAAIVKPTESADPEHWSIQLKRDGQRPVSIPLCAVDMENRSAFLDALERWAPNCNIQIELAEAMIPKHERGYTELWLQSLSSSPDRKSLDPLSPGQTLLSGRYEVVRRLGIGGQGTAYLCRDMEREWGVVLKETILPIHVDRLVKEQSVQRFQNEARILQEVDSDHIMKLLDYFIEDHRGYLVLNHIEGRTLRQIVEEDGPINPERAMRLALMMCDALETLHGKSILHRDFTPDNMILQENGCLCLIDFNVAQVIQTGSTGSIVGKPAYVAPEQFRGKPNLQSDIYALGATLFFILIGADPEPITESSPIGSAVSCPAALDQIVRACTMLDCSRRFQTASQVRMAVEDALSDGEVIAVKQQQRGTVNG